MNNFKKLVSAILSAVLILSMVGIPAAADELWDPFNGDKDVNIVYLGGSHTFQGNGWRDNIGNYIKSTYEMIVPGRTITNYNAGIGGTNSTYGVTRLAEDVISKDPDLVFVEYASNDRTVATNLSDARSNQVINAMEGIVRRLQSLPKPPMIVYVYIAGSTFENSSEIHSKVANYYDIPQVDFRQLMLDLGYTPDTTAKTYDELTPRLKNLWNDLTHANSDGHKIWSDYLIGEMQKNPQKYFRHPKLKTNPISNDNYGSVTAEFKTVKEIYDEGNISFSNSSGGKLTEGTDYTFEKNGTLAITGGNNSAEIKFSGNILSPVITVNAEDGTEFTYSIDNNKVSGKGSCYYGGEAAFSQMNLGKGPHSAKFTVSPQRPAGGKGDVIRIKGVYVEKEQDVFYPQSYPSDVIINTYVEKDEEVQEPADQSSYQDEIDVIKALGIMTGDENGSFLPKEGLTRAEFAKILSIILQIESADNSQAWYKQFLTENDNNNTIMTPTPPVEDMFTDVDAEHWAKSVIEQIASYGYMSGTTDKTFNPDEKVTVNEAVKTFVKLLGYEVKATINGGYPVGYNYIANELKMTKGLNSFGESPIKREEVAKLIYNCFDLEVLNVTSVGENTKYNSTNGETMLTKIMNMDRVYGVITDNGITSRTGTSEIGRDFVKIADKTYGTNAKTKYIKDFIGRYVEMYVTNNLKDGLEKVVYARVDSKDESLTINVKDFVSIENGKLTYLDNDVVTDAEITSAPFIIYNGNAIKSIDSSYFNYDFGTITLSSSSRSGTYDTIKTELYKSWYVDNIDQVNFRLYNENASTANGGSDFMLELDPNNKSLFAFIYDNKGNELDFNKITTGSVIDICISNNYVKLIVTNKEIKDSVIESTGTSDDGILVGSNGVEYNIIDDFINGANGYTPVVGDSCTFHLNSFGWIAFISDVSATTGTIGYLINLVSNSKGVNTVTKAKILNNKGSIEVFELQEKVTLNDELGEIRKCKSEDVNNIISGYRGLVGYILNDKGVLSEIIIPIQDKNADRNKGRIGFISTLTGDNSKYSSPSTQFGGEVQINNNTKLFRVNEMANEEKKQYQVINLKRLVDGRAYTLKAYNTVFDSPYADYVVIQDSTVEDLLPSLNKAFFIATKVVNTVNSDGEQCKKVYGYQVESGGAAKSAEVLSNNGAFDKAADIVKSGATYSIMAGDIFRFYSFNDNVESAELIYRSEATYPGSATKGVLAGTIKNYLSTAAGKTNPLAVSSDGTVLTNANVFTNGEIRVLLGSAYHLVDNMLKYTSQDLTVESYNPSDSSYCVESIKLPTNITTITYSNGNVKVEAGSVSDIKTYKQVGNDCSKVLINTRSGRIEKVFIINGLNQD